MILCYVVNTYIVVYHVVVALVAWYTLGYNKAYMSWIQ
jgi:hypothetical protein